MAGTTRAGNWSRERTAAAESPTAQLTGCGRRRSGDGLVDELLAERRAAAESE